MAQPSNHKNGHETKLPCHSMTLWKKNGTFNVQDRPFQFVLPMGTQCLLSVHCSFVVYFFKGLRTLMSFLQ